MSDQTIIPEPKIEASFSSGIEPTSTFPNKKYTSLTIDPDDEDYKQRRVTTTISPSRRFTFTRAIMYVLVLFVFYFVYINLGKSKVVNQENIQEKIVPKKPIE
ncbi:hypothetical protein HDV04_004899 [Boothiomyces sp. JEL0838]|nr:hypothetical protein HDV04_004899 [Boothiomyces sp. JEL0838]